MSDLFDELMKLPEAGGDTQLDGSSYESKAGMITGIDKNPDAFSKTVKIANEAGLPTVAVEGNEQQIEKQNRITSLNFDEMSKINPILAKNLRDYNFSGIAHDDVKELGAFETFTRNLKTYANDIGDSFDRGLAVVDVGELSNKKTNALSRGVGEWTKEDELALSDAKKAQDKKLKEYGFFAGIIPQGVETIPFLFEAVKGNLGGRAAGTVIGGAIGSIVGPEGTVAGAAIGNNIGGFIGSFYQMWDVNAGQMADELSDLTDENGNTLSQETVANASQVGGIFESLLDVASFKFAGRLIPEKVSRLYIKKQLEGALKTKGGRAAVVEFAKVMGEVTAVEAVTEGLQEQVEIATDEIAKYIDMGAFKNATLSDAFSALGNEENINRTLGAAKGGAQAALFLGGHAAVFNASANALQTETKSQEGAKKINELASAAENSKTRERSPETFNQMAGEALDGQSIHLDVDAVDAYLNTLEGKQLDDAAIRLKSALDNTNIGQDVEISAADYASFIAGTVHDKALRPHMRLDVGDVSPARLAGHRTEQEAFMQQLMDKQLVDAKAQNEIKKVGEDVANQLVATGRMEKKQARTAAKLMQMRVAILATYKQNEGKSIEELYKEIGLTIEGDITKRAKKAEVVPPSAFNQQQDLGETKLTQERTTPNGERVTITQKAQREWDRTAKRRDVASKLMDCLNG